MQIELTDEEQRHYGEMARGFYINDGGSPITLDYPWAEMPRGSYSRISLHQALPSGPGGVIGVTAFQRGREVTLHSDQFPEYHFNERPAAPNEIWMFVQVAKFFSDSEIIMPPSRLETILGVARRELIRQRGLIDRYLSQI